MKKIAASDSRQSVGLKWKLRKGLEENVAFKEDGTMEVGKNLNVDGKAKLGYVGKCTYNLFGSPFDFFVLEAMSTSGENPGPRFVAFLPIVGTAEDGGENFNAITDIYGFLINNKDGTPATTINEALNGELDAVPFPISLQGRWQYAEFGQLRVYSGKIGLSTTEGDDADLRLISTASQAKYQHTVTIKGTRPAQGGGSCFIAFTANSSKNTPVHSAQDLIDVFGGRTFSVSGMYSPSQGTNFGAIKLYLNGASTIADASLAYIDPSLVGEAGVKISECGNLSFEDDVGTPK